MKNKFSTAFLITLVIILGVFSFVFYYIKTIEVSPEEPKALLGQNYGALRVFTVQQGGTGATSFTAGECVVGNGTSALSTQACGTGSFSGTLNDILDVSTTTTSIGDLLMWNGTYWTNNATSTLGITGGVGSETDPIWNASSSEYLKLSIWYATTTDILDEGTNNLYWTNARFDARLHATTSLPNLSITERQISDLQSYLVSADVNTIAELNAILTGEDVASTTYYTWGDALTITANDIDFDGGSAPAGALGGTWASPTVDSDGTWTGHNSYPAACSAGQFVGTIGDTNTCAAPVGANEAYASGWNSDTGVPEKDDIYDWGHVLDTDDDGLINGMDTNGIDAITEIAAALKDGSGDCATGLICLGDHTHSGYYDALTDITLTNGYIFSGNSSNNPIATSTIFITSAGYVGIGTTTPQAKLVVDSGATATTTTQLGSATMGVNPAKICWWNGSNFTIEYYPVNSVTKTTATSTSCN